MNVQQHQTQAQPTTGTVPMWRSKLGTNYTKEFMDKNEKRLMDELNSIRNLPDNRYCADCGTNGTVWASVNLGVFLCMTCGAHHRSLGTHVSLPKGCTGTYLWGPDEIESMKSKGNAHAKVVFGDVLPPQDLKKDVHVEPWIKFLTDKYVLKKYAPKISYVHNTITASPSPPQSPTRLNNSFSKMGSSHHSPTTVFNKQTLQNTNIDLITFDSGSPTTMSPNSGHNQKTTRSTPTNTTKHTLSSPSSKNPSETNFFAEFGL